MAARLPQVGGDDNDWGTILNTFLLASHNADGTLSTAAVTTALPSPIPTANLGSGTASSSNFLRGDGTWAVPSGGGGGSSTLAGDTDVSITTPSNNQVLTYNSGSSKWVNQTALVTSVAGRTGAVTLAESDVANLTTDLGSKLVASNNLSDVGSVATARSNLGASQGLVPTAVKTSTYVAAAGDFVPVDASGGGVTITLPTAPADKSRVEVKMINTASTNIVTINTGGSDVFNKTGGTTSATLSLLNQAVMLQYTASTAIWYVQSDDLPLSQLDGRYLALGGGSLTGAVAVGAAFTMTPVNLTDAATIAVNAALGNSFRVTIGGNRTLGNPTNATDGQFLNFSITQDGTGSRLLTLGTNFHFGTDITSITLSTTPGATDKIGVQYNQSAGHFDVIAFVRGF